VGIMSFFLSRRRISLLPSSDIAFHGEPNDINII
jgi:hypothetical protein